MWLYSLANLLVYYCVPTLFFPFLGFWGVSLDCVELLFIFQIYHSLLKALHHTFISKKLSLSDTEKSVEAARNVMCSCFHFVSFFTFLTKLISKSLELCVQSNNDDDTAQCGVQKPVWHFCLALFYLVKQTIKESYIFLFNNSAATVINVIYQTKVEYVAKLCTAGHFDV